MAALNQARRTFTGMAAAAGGWFLGGAVYQLLQGNSIKRMFFGSREEMVFQVFTALIVATIAI